MRSAPAETGTLPSAGSKAMPLRRFCVSRARSHNHRFPRRRPVVLLVSLSWSQSRCLILNSLRPISAASYQCNSATWIEPRRYPRAKDRAQFLPRVHQHQRGGLRLPPSLFELRRMANPPYRIPRTCRPICLDGQISDLPVQPPLQKYFRLRLSQITSYPIPSRPIEGRLAIVTDAGRDAVDAAVPARMR
jgi:hypothetical protein